MIWKMIPFTKETLELCKGFPLRVSLAVNVLLLGRGTKDEHGHLFDIVSGAKKQHASKKRRERDEKETKRDEMHAGE